MIASIAGAICFFLSGFLLGTIATKRYLARKRLCQIGNIRREGNRVHMDLDQWSYSMNLDDAQHTGRCIYRAAVSAETVEAIRSKYDQYLN